MSAQGSPKSFSADALKRRRSSRLHDWKCAGCHKLLMQFDPALEHSGHEEVLCVRCKTLNVRTNGVMSEVT